MVRIVKRVIQGLKARVKFLLPDEYVVKRQFKERNGYPLDMENQQGLAEKLCWLKLKHIDPLQSPCVDKVAVRRFVSAVLGEEALIPLIDVLDSAEAVTPDRITASQFIIKTNHDSGGVLICHDRDTFDWEAARQFMARRMRMNHYWKMRERAYRAVRPRLLVETLLPSSDSEPLLDYKLWCFHGKVEFFAASLINTSDDGKRDIAQSFFDRYWNKLDIRREFKPISQRLEKPEKIEEMILFAERLSSPFLFCRVDLYNCNSKIYFGELTFYPSGGYLKFEPPSEERRLGDLLNLPR